MTAIEAVIDRFAIQNPTISGNPFRLASSFGPPATNEQLRRAWGASVPMHMEPFWRVARDASLFVDMDYGQWGLHILSPTESAARTRAERATRPRDVLRNDVVVGEFLGDQDLLVVDEEGEVLVALPIDRRVEWPVVAPDIVTFLDRYRSAGGNKYWESDA